MHLRTYTGTSIQVVMAQIKKELGLDAIIVSTANEHGIVRVTVAHEQDQAIPQEKFNDYMKLNDSIAGRSRVLDVKNLLCDILSYHSPPNEIIEEITSNVYALPNTALNDGMTAILNTLFKFYHLNYSNYNMQHLMLSGPVGVGKTVTLTKIATELLVCKKRVELILTDYLRAGSIEQMQAYASAINVPLHLINNPTELAKKLERANANNNDVVYLIDTPSTNCLNSSETTKLQEFVLAAKLSPILVLSAGGDSYEMIETAGAFRNFGCSRLMMTRFDATRRLGGLLSILHKEKFEFSAMSFGPEIGNRLWQATADNLLKVLTRYIPDKQQKIDEIQSKQLSNDSDLPSWISTLKVKA